MAKKAPPMLSAKARIGGLQNEKIKTYSRFLGNFGEKREY